MICVLIPNNQIVPEVEYVLGILFRDVLGLPWRCQVAKVNDFKIRLDGHSGEISLPNVFFQNYTDGNAGYQRNPNSLHRWDTRELIPPPKLIDPVISMIFGESRSGMVIVKDRIYLPLDVLGSMFFMLSRYEETTFTKLDGHGRFAADASIFSHEDILDRPILDSYIEILWNAVQILWPSLKRKELTAQSKITCDIDNPYEFYVSNRRTFIKKLGGDLLKRKSLGEFSRTWHNYSRTARGDYSADPNNTFDWMMDVNEKAGNRMAFYFLADNPVPMLDAHYSIDEPRIRQLMRRIYDRGHEIGLHASYGTYKNPQQIKKEADKLRQVMDEEGIKQDEIGSRQHYLRWSTPETARHLEAAGIAYDTTLGYADHAGFRCGTSHEFPLFDIENQKVLKLRERPLIMMEASVLSPKYMNMGYSDQTFDYMKSLKEKCFYYGGNFTLLWHNSFFKSEKDKVFYQELINA
jgi:peptidoglycan/xylan/chitin deacetylase (PgdA/CDA1 family)